MTPDNPSISGSPEELQYDRGTLDRINKALLAAQLDVMLKDGDLKRTEFELWRTKPWTALEFLISRVSKTKDSVQANPDRDIARTTSIFLDPKYISFDDKLKADVLEVNRDLFGEDSLNILAEWYEAATKSSTERKKWENTNPDRKDQATKAVNILCDVLSERAKVFENTSESLRFSKKTNAVESILRGTKEYVWDEFKDHPEMSIGLVVLSYLALKKIKGTKLGTFLGLAVGTTVAGAFLKDKFGVQPTERMAEIAERMGMNKLADGIRDVADTGMRVLFGAEGEGTINGYFCKKLGFRRDNEKTTFNFLLTQNPKKFMDWYDDAKKWKSGTDQRPPGDVASLVYEISRGRNVSSQFRKMSIAEKTKLLLDVSDEVFKHIAVQNNKPESVGEGINILRNKYVDGKYFDVMWDRFNNDLTAMEKKYTDPAILDQIKRVRAEAKNFQKGMGERLVRGSDQILFMHVLYVENGDNDEIGKFVGTGWTGAQIKGVLEDSYDKLRELVIVAGGKMSDLGEAGYDYVSADVPDYWKNTGWPALKTAFETTKDVVWDGSKDRPGPAKEVYEYLFDEKAIETKDKDKEGKPITISRFKLAINRAKETGSKTVDIAIDNPVSDLLKEIGIQAGGAIEVTLEQAEEMAEWIRERKKLDSVKETFKNVVWEPTGSIDPRSGIPTGPLIIFDLDSSDAKIADGYKYLVSIIPIEEEDPTFIVTENTPRKEKTNPPALVISLPEATPLKASKVPIPYAIPATKDGYIIRRLDVVLTIEGRAGSLKVTRKKYQISL